MSATAITRRQWAQFVKDDSGNPDWRTIQDLEQLDANASDALALLTPQLAVTRGGTGVTTITGYLKGNGIAAFTGQATIPASDVSGVADTRIPFGSTGNLTSAADLTYDAVNKVLTVNSSRWHATGTSNTFLGKTAGNFTLTGTGNTGFGEGALAVVTSGLTNTAAGLSAGANIQSGSNNVAIGSSALAANQAGSSCVAIGAGALALSTTSSNVGVGLSALAVTVSGGSNVALGTSALSGVTGASNTGIGHNAGNTITTGSSNTCVGATANVTAAAASNRTALGNAASSDTDNQVMLGNASVTEIVAAGTTNLGSTSKLYNKLYCTGIVGALGATNAAAGDVGEYIEARVTTGAPFAMTSGVNGNVASISLTGGDWDVGFNAGVTGGATTLLKFTQFGVSTTSATMPTNENCIFYGDPVAAGSAKFTNAGNAGAGPDVRISLAAGTTTVYLVGLASFTTSTCNAFGLIYARRRR